jgi:hypothetical protein
VSPVPFEKLRQAIETGPGRPDFQPVADQMAQANNLVSALALAPIAGAAAAVGKFIAATKSKQPEE